MITKTRLFLGGLIATLIPAIYFAANVGTHVVEIAAKHGHS
jgi:hypothetical protein